MPGMPSTPTAVETGAELRIDLAQSLAIRERVRLPAGARKHDVALGEGRIVRGDDLGHRAAFHHAADRHRRGVGWTFAHAPAHIGIKRQPDRCAAAPRPPPGRNRVILDAKVRRLRLADGTRHQNDALCLGTSISSDYSCHCAPKIQRPWIGLGDCQAVIFASAASNAAAALGRSLKARICRVSCRSFSEIPARTSEKGFAAIDHSGRRADMKFMVLDRRVL